MKQHTGRRLWIAVIAATIVAALALAVWNPPFLSGIFGDGYTPVTIPAEDFSADGDALAGKPRLIVISGFHAAKLGNDRNLHIYLPPGYYEDTDKEYPVLYANDGKNVFDVSDWSKESMNMHTQADKLIFEGKVREMIIVGIDNTGDNRTAEYAHWDGVDMGKPVTGVGELYEDFVLNDVKLFIDANFRTLPGRDDTAFMGESIGGLSVFNIGFKHPDVFSKLAMLSPYFGWGDGRLFGMISGGPYKEKQAFKLWIDVGSKEDGFVDMAAQGVALLTGSGYQYGSDLFAYEVPGGEHSEKYWSQRVESILLCFFGDIGKPESLKLYTDGQLSLSCGTIEHINAVITYDSGFKMTDLTGAYSVQNPDVLKVENFGGAMYPKAEGTTEVTYTAASGISAKTAITVVK